MCVCEGGGGYSPSENWYQLTAPSPLFYISLWNELIFHYAYGFGTIWNKAQIYAAPSSPLVFTMTYRQLPENKIFDISVKMCYIVSHN